MADSSRSAPKKTTTAAPAATTKPATTTKATTTTKTTSTKTNTTKPAAKTTTATYAGGTVKATPKYSTGSGGNQASSGLTSAAKTAVSSSNLAKNSGLGTAIKAAIKSTPAKNYYNNQAAAEYKQAIKNGATEYYDYTNGNKYNYVGAKNESYNADGSSNIPTSGTVTSPITPLQAALSNTGTGTSLRDWATANGVAVGWDEKTGNVTLGNTVYSPEALEGAGFKLVDGRWQATSDKSMHNFETDYRAANPWTNFSTDGTNNYFTDPTNGHTYTINPNTAYIEQTSVNNPYYQGSEQQTMADDEFANYAVPVDMSEYAASYAPASTSSTSYSGGTVSGDYDPLSASDMASMADTWAALQTDPQLAALNESYQDYLTSYNQQLAQIEADYANVESTGERLIKEARDDALESAIARGAGRAGVADYMMQEAAAPIQEQITDAMIRKEDKKFALALALANQQDTLNDSTQNIYAQRQNLIQNWLNSLSQNERALALQYMQAQMNYSLGQQQNANQSQQIANNLASSMLPYTNLTASELANLQYQYSNLFGQQAGSTNYNNGGTTSAASNLRNNYSGTASGSISVSDLIKSGAVLQNGKWVIPASKASALGL
jgi:hypothetical protein